MSNWDTKFLKKGYTFDDVLLIPAESHVLPNNVNLQTKLAKNLTLNIPIITASAMVYRQQIARWLFQSSCRRFRVLFTKKYVYCRTS